MSERPTKRVRSSSGSDDRAESTPSPTTKDFIHASDLVTLLDNKTVSNILANAASRHPDIMRKLEHEVSLRAAADKDKIIYFDYLSKSVWTTLNVTYDRMRDSQSFDMSGEASASIRRCLETIRKQCPKTAGCDTKQSALETLRKIGKSICLSQGIIPKQIRNDHITEQTLVATMLGIAKTMTSEEREGLWPWCEEKLMELQKLGEGYVIFEGLDEVIDLFAYEDEVAIEDVAKASAEELDSDGDGNGNGEADHQEKSIGPNP